MPDRDECIEFCFHQAKKFRDMMDSWKGPEYSDLHPRWMKNAEMYEAMARYIAFGKE